MREYSVHVLSCLEQTHNFLSFVFKHLGMVNLVLTEKRGRETEEDENFH